MLIFPNIKSSYVNWMRSATLEPHLVFLEILYGWVFHETSTPQKSKAELEKISNFLGRRLQHPMAHSCIAFEFSFHSFFICLGHSMLQMFFPLCNSLSTNWTAPRGYRHCVAWKLAVLQRKFFNQKIANSFFEERPSSDLFTVSLTANFFSRMLFCVFIGGVVSKNFIH